MKFFAMWLLIFLAAAILAATPEILGAVVLGTAVTTLPDFFQAMLVIVAAATMAILTAAAVRRFS